AGGPDVVIPNPLAIVERLGRPESRTPDFGHLPVLLPNEIVDTGLSSLPRIERVDAFVDFRAQCAQLFDMRQQCPPDLFLILGGQPLHFGNGLFKCFDHDASISNHSTQNRGSRDVRRSKLPRLSKQQAVPDFAEPVIGPATSGRTRWLHPGYELPISGEPEIGARPPQGDGVSKRSPDGTE